MSRERSAQTTGGLLACTRYRPAHVRGDPERDSTAAGGLHTVGTYVARQYRHRLLSLPETVGLEVCGVAGVRVLIHEVELLRRRRHTQLRHGGSIPRFILLADVVRYSDGSEDADDDDERIVIKTQTQESLGFVPCSPRAASTGWNRRDACRSKSRLRWPQAGEKEDRPKSHQIRTFYCSLCSRMFYETFSMEDHNPDALQRSPNEHCCCWRPIRR